MDKAFAWLMVFIAAQASLLAAAFL